MNENFKFKNFVATSSNIEAQFRNEERLLSRQSIVDKFVDSRIQHLNGQFKVAIGTYMARNSAQNSPIDWFSNKNSRSKSVVGLPSSVKTPNQNRRPISVDIDFSFDDVQSEEELLERTLEHRRIIGLKK